MNKKKKNNNNANIFNNTPNVLNPIPNIDIEETQISIFEWNSVNGLKEMQLVDYTSIIRRCGIPLDFTHFIASLAICKNKFIGVNPLVLDTPYREIMQFCFNKYDNIKDEQEVFIRVIIKMLLFVPRDNMSVYEVINILESLRYEDSQLEKDIINNRTLLPLICAVLKEVQFTPKGYFNLVFYSSEFPSFIDSIPSYPKNWNWNLLVNSKNQTIYHIIFALSI